MKALEGTFNQEKALVQALSVITDLVVDLGLKLYLLLLTSSRKLSRFILPTLENGEHYNLYFR